ncbi:MAG: cytochrome c3 family protein [Phycisphaerales bacterium]|nr:cytochrome c3 family protein [Phycisphaerales bacterium]
MSTIFPKWTNNLPTLLAGGAVGTLAVIVGVVWYYFTPEYWSVGYMPTQPGGGFNHQIHVGKLGMDCRYCHTNVEKSAEANVPTVSTCYGCHADGRLAKLTSSQGHAEKTAFIREAYAKDEPIEWRRVHKVPDYVRNFPHHAHVNAGVSCYSCHGNIGRMPVVYQAKSLSMSWCLDCHRNPEPHLVAKDDVYRLFDVEDRNAADPSGSGKRLTEGKRFYEERKIAAPENCGACHY